MIHVKAIDAAVTDYFSFEQVRALAIQIIHVCGEEERGGYGGRGRIGREMNFIVNVFGFRLSPPHIDAKTA